MKQHLRFNTFMLLCLFLSMILLASQTIAAETKRLVNRKEINQIKQQTELVAEGSAIVTNNLVMDSSFELGTVPTFWTQTSTNFGSPLCTIATCGNGGGTGPHSGDWWAWFGGIAVDETATLDQTGIIPQGKIATLSFFLQIPVSDSSGFLKVLIDGNLILEITNADAASYASYALVTVPVSTYADGAAHTLRFEGTTTGGGTTNIFVDDVVIKVDSFPWPAIVPAVSGARITQP